MRKSDRTESDSSSVSIEVERLIEGLAKRRSSPLLAERVRVAITHVLRQYGLIVNLDELSEDLTNAVSQVLVKSTGESPEMLLVTLSFMYSSFASNSLSDLGERLSEAPIRAERDPIPPDASSVSESDGITGSDSDMPIEVARLMKDLVFRRQKSALAPLLGTRLREAIAAVLRHHGVYNLLLSEDLKNGIYRVLVDFTNEAPEMFLLTLRCLTSSFGYVASMLDKRLSELELTDEDGGSAC